MKTIHIIAAAVAAISLFSACGGQETGQNVLSLDEIIAQRRSVRDYDASKTISQDEIRTLIATTQESPTWANTQTPRYYAVMSPDKLAALKGMIGEGNKRNTEGAPVLLVSTFIKDRAGFGRGAAVNELGNAWGAYDTGVSNAYLILKAREMGFDTLIMGMRDAEAIAELLDIPETETVVAVIALGYRASDPQRPNRKSLDEVLEFK